MKFGDGPVSKNKLAILKIVYPLIYKTNRNTPNKLISCWLTGIIGTAECILINKLNTFTDSLEYTYLKENKSLLWALQERGREKKTACFSSLVTSDLFNALWVITKFTATDRAAPQMLNLRQICGQLCYRPWPSHFGQTDQKSINSTAIN